MKRTEFSDNLKRLREQAQMTPKEVALKLGIPYTTYLGYENNGREPNYSMLCQIATCIGTTVDTLLGFSIDPLTEALIMCRSAGFKVKTDCNNQGNFVVHIQFTAGTFITDYLKKMGLSHISPSGELALYKDEFLTMMTLLKIENEKQVNRMIQRNVEMLAAGMILSGINNKGNAD